MALKVADIPRDRLDALNRGDVASAVLTECLAIDFATLMRAIAADLPDDSLTALQGKGITQRMALSARALLAQMDVADVVKNFGAHPSDTVRGWVCYAIGAADGWGMEKRLHALRPFADDAHFGVREWAWLALRPHIAEDLPASLSLLTTWTSEASENLRRFASEATRPRGVWCAHLKPLVADPAKGLPLLEPLRADPALYVRNSVANWLNDAAKTQPDWVRGVCKRWQAESLCDETRYITRRGMRSL